jgi:hypothetical protein
LPTGHVSDDSEDFPISFRQDYHNRHKQVKLKKRVKYKGSGRLTGELLLLLLLWAHVSFTGSNRDPTEIIDITSDSEERMPSPRKNYSSTSFSPPAAEVIVISSDTDDNEIAIKPPVHETPSSEIVRASDTHPDITVSGPSKRLTSPETSKRQSEALHPTHDDLGSSTPGSINDKDLPSPSSDAPAPQPSSGDSHGDLEGFEETIHPEDIPATTIPESEHPKSPLPSQTPRPDPLQVEGIGMDKGHVFDTPQPLSASSVGNHKQSDRGLNDLSTAFGSGTVLPPQPIPVFSKSPKVIPESLQRQCVTPTSAVVDHLGELSIKSFQPSNDNAHHEKWKPGSRDEGFDADADGLWASFYRDRPSLKARAWARHVQPESQAQNLPEPLRTTTSTLLLADKITSSAASGLHGPPSQPISMAPNDGGTGPSVETVPDVPQATTDSQKVTRILYW